MNHCPHCGKALEDACSFCPYCGKPLSAYSKPKKKLPLKAIICILALLGVLAGTQVYPKLFSKSLSADTKASASVVTIYTYDVNNVPLGNGSGFAAMEEGLIITNHHVIEGETYRIEAVTESGTVMEADSIICYDADKDIAILRFYDCPLPRLITTDGMDLGVPFGDVKTLYDNRDPYAEITPAKLWAQTKHSYTVDYVLAYPRQLSGKTIELKGYVSAVQHDLYLVASPTQILDPKAKDLSDLIYDQWTAGSSLMCQRESRGSFPDDLAGKYVTLRGKVTVYSENTSGDDVRFIVSEVIASE